MGEETPEELILSQNDFFYLTEKDLGALAQIAFETKKIRLASCHFSAEAIHYFLKTLSKIKKGRLEELILTYNNFSYFTEEHGEILAKIAAKMKKIDLIGCGLSAEALRGLGKKISKVGEVALEELNLSDNDFSQLKEEHGEILAKIAAKTKKIDLSYCGLSAEALQGFRKQLSKVGKGVLKELNLSWSSFYYFTEGHGEELAQIATKTKKIDLSYCKLSAEAIHGFGRKINKMGQGSLKELNLSGSISFPYHTEKDLEALTQIAKTIYIEGLPLSITHEEEKAEADIYSMAEDGNKPLEIALQKASKEKQADVTKKFDEAVQSQIINAHGSSGEQNKYESIIASTSGNQREQLEEIVSVADALQQDAGKQSLEKMVEHLTHKIKTLENLQADYVNKNDPKWQQLNAELEHNMATEQEKNTIKSSEELTLYHQTVFVELSSALHGLLISYSGLIAHNRGFVTEAVNKAQTSKKSKSSSAKKATDKVHHLGEIAHEGTQLFHAASEVAEGISNYVAPAVEVAGKAAKLAHAAAPILGGVFLVGTAAGVVSWGLGKTVDRFEKKKFETSKEIAGAVAQSNHETAEETARILTLRYQNQILCLEDEGIVTLAKYAVQRMLVGIFEGVIEKENVPEALANAVRSINMKKILKRKKAWKFALPFTEEAFLPTKYSSDENWTEAGIYQQTGVMTNGDVWHNKNVTDTKRYGCCLMKKKPKNETLIRDIIGNTSHPPSMRHGAHRPLGQDDMIHRQVSGVAIAHRKTSDNVNVLKENFSELTAENLALKKSSEKLGREIEELKRQVTLLLQSAESAKPVPRSLEEKATRTTKRTTSMDGIEDDRMASPSL